MSINVLTGKTEPDIDGHVHEYVLRLTSRGVLKGGVSSFVNGHFHRIDFTFITGEPEKEEEGEPQPIHSHNIDIMKCDFIENMLNNNMQNETENIIT